MAAATDTDTDTILLNRQISTVDNRVYDITPFVSAPAVQEKYTRDGTVKIINIPDASIPSPLAPDLSPGTIFKIKEYLLGKEGEQVHIGDRTAGNGYEVWASWKRAWDLWNNHYIEGRVNPVWVAEEWTRKKQEREDHDRAAEDAARQTAHLYRRNGGVVPMPSTFGAPFRASSRSRPPTTTQTVEDLTGEGNGLSGSLRLVGQPLDNQPPRPAAPGKKWELRKFVSTRPTGRGIAVKDGYPVTIGSNHPRARRSEDLGRSSNEAAPLGVRPQWEILEEDGDEQYGLQYSSDGMRDEGEQEMEKYEVQSWVEVDDPNVKRRRPSSQDKDKENDFSPKRVKFAEGNDSFQSGVMEGFVPLPPQTSKTASPRKSNTRTKREASPSRTSPRKQVQSYAHAGTARGQRASMPAPRTSTEDTPMLDQPLLTHPSTIKSNNVKANPKWYTTPDNSLLNPSRQQKSIPDDGNSGGWVPIKNFPQYREPEDPQCDDPDDPEQIAYDNLIWDDIVENSVWRPRRVGEKCLKIDFDEEDPRDFPKQTDLSFDGGVDCGREPYPVLRSLIEYLTAPDGTIKKKKVWDGVTGTVFNLPTTPLQPEPELTDPKLRLVKAMYSNPYRDFRHDVSPTFPLDIRRCERVVDKNIVIRLDPLLENGETSLMPRDNELLVEDRPMEDADPWWVTDQQKRLRNNPPRCWPPGAEKNGPLLPTDDTIWKQEVYRDQTSLTAYFVTNLHGGTLIINGQQVLKGAIAGPLPAFAVIEGPGGQVAFWWGVNGRKYRAGEEGADYSRKWDILRQQDAWKHVAMSAGQVWDLKIEDRAMREKSGNDEDDDDEWNRWKATQPAEKEANGRHAYPLYEVPRFTNKQDHEDELKWVAARLRRKESDKTSGQGHMVEPSEDDFWTGTKPRVDTRPKSIDQDEIDRVWKEDGPLITFRQTAYVQLLEDKKKREEQEAKDFMNAEIAATKKRKADGTLNAKTKKARQDREDAVQKLIDDLNMREKQRVAEVKARKQLAYEKVKILQDNASLSRSVQDLLAKDPRACPKEARKKIEHQRREKLNYEAMLLEKVNEERKRQGRTPLLSRFEWEKENLGVTGAVRLSDGDLEAARERIKKREEGQRARDAQARQRARQERALRDREERQAKERERIRQQEEDDERIHQEMEQDRLAREKKKTVTLIPLIPVPEPETPSSATINIVQPPVPANLQSIQVDDLPVRTVEAIQMDQEAKRAKDFVHEQHELARLSKQFREDVYRRDREGAGFSRLRVTMENKFNTLEEMIEARPRLAMKMNFGHDTLQLEDIPWREITPWDNDTQAVKDLISAMKVESRENGAKLINVKLETSGEADELEYLMNNKGLTELERDESGVSVLIGQPSE